MGHDIFGYNHAGRKIAYARFSMSNYNADVLYKVLDSQEHNGGVSGVGARSTFSVHQMDHALQEFIHSHENKYSLSGNDPDNVQIKEFLENCLETARKEGEVEVCFA
ncbi:hypothetical protein [Alkalibacillus haloalkaliphilus]|uniref:hypothetical protein n=1 Tax=Alkalibacillus haloalkaliphilus TaxID=94136 RepID=UPI0029365078|nr:hypothetical protein [Alkalibacillus haloalkaliphilus]MDV2583328.1 hypothetical protein [Alkalibacillus haloalkaliphilus]